ncbi:hypothetical protein [Jannaschia rubra]|uniref:hypothetical protein n=1 Tax=Jannaschia rubra TaxID=282197 RepID=UPI00249335CE|nr:hypothetical protein [Jannaschia rubra]
MTGADGALRAALERLGRKGGEWTAAGRVVVPAGATDAETVQTALLEEIGDTVLTARLAFDAGSVRLVLLAGGRRLRAVVAGPDVPEGLSGQALDAAEEGAVVQAAEVLRGFAQMAAAGGGPVAVLSLAAPRGAGDTDGGLTPGLLAARWAAGMGTGDPATDDTDDGPGDGPGRPLAERLLARAAPILRAHALSRGGAVAGQGGDAAMLPPAPDTGPGLTLWLAGGDALAVLRAEGPEGAGDVATLALAAADAPALVAGWQRLIRG